MGGRFILKCSFIFHEYNQVLSFLLINNCSLKSLVSRSKWHSYRRLLLNFEI